MTAQDKLAVGMTVFVVVFVVALLALPRSVYQRYFAHLEVRKRGRIVKALLTGVFVLSVPFLYDQLVGFDSKATSSLLQFLVGAAAYGVLMDVAWFAYKSFRPRSDRRSASK